jgi:general secretion pathway protein D
VLPSLPCRLTRSKASLLLLACLLAPWAALAQDPAQPAGPPGIATPPPILVPLVVSVPGTPATGGEELVQMQLPNADVRDVLSYYERLTGKRLVLDSTIQGQINIVVNGKVTKSEAIKLIETALLLNGFSIVPGDGVTKVLGLSKNARGAGVSIYSDFSQLPEGELVVSYLFRLRYLDPTELQQILQQYITANLYTSFVALPKSGALLVTESTSVIRKLVQLVRDVDIPPAEVVEEFIRLERADATKAAEFLTAVFERKDSTNAAPTGNRNRARPASNNQAGGNPQPNVAVPGVLDNPGLQTAVTGMTEDAIVVGKIQITADVRTNRVHVVTRPVNMPLVRRLIAEYDANTPFADPVKRRLKYVSARDVLPILVQSLTEPGTDQAGGGQGQQGRSAAQTGQQNPLFANQNRGSSSSSSSGASSGTSSSGGGLNLTQGLETQQQDTTPSAVVVGNTKLIADPRDNAIIIQGSGEAVDRVTKIIAQLDVRAPQVLISAVIGEFSLGDGFESGVDYVLQSHPVTAFTRFTGSGPVDRTQGGLISQLSNTLSSFNGAGALIKATSNFSILVKLLESSNRFKTISRPVVFASNNKKAVIASGQEIAVPTQTLSNVGTPGGIVTNGTTSVSSSIEFKSVTLQLEVIPLINSDNEVTLDIYQKIDSVVAGGSVQIAGNTVPTIATRYVRSTLSVPNDSTIVLGGLIKQDESKSINGLPFLSRIPVLGYLFRDTNKTNSRSELIILLHPVVTNTAKQLARGRYNEEQRYFMTGDLEGQLYPPGRPVPLPGTESVRKAIRVNPTTPKSKTRVLPTPKDVVRSEESSTGG